MTVYDCIGVGFGPANIALAVALEERAFPGKVLFLEQRSSSAWHPDMLLPGSDIQNHPCRDLITPKNPRSRYTFINFLHEHDRLFEHLNLGLLFPLRAEYAQYVAWVASFFKHLVRFEHHVNGIRIERAGAEEIFRISTNHGDFRSRCIIVAPGRTPNIPHAFREKTGGRVVHLTNFLSALGSLPSSGDPLRLAVVGGSQSAVEIVLHLNDTYRNATIHNVMRGHGYRTKDVSPFTGYVFFPEFVDYFYQCKREAKQKISRELRYTNYSAADSDVINRLYVTMYEQKLAQRERIQLQRCRDIERCEVTGDGVSLCLREQNTGEQTVLEDLDLVVLATGFLDLGDEERHEPYPSILTGIADRLGFGDGQMLQIGRDYKLCGHDAGPSLPPLYLNGLCESSHGYGDAGSFSLLALRAAEIATSIEKHVLVAPTASAWRGGPERSPSVP